MADPRNPEVVVGVRTDTRRFKAGMSEVERDIASLNRLAATTVRTQMLGISTPGARARGTIPGSPPPFYSPSNRSPGLDNRLNFVGDTMARRIRDATGAAQEYIKKLNDENRIYREGIRLRKTLHQAERDIQLQRLRDKGTPERLLTQIRRAEQTRDNYVAALSGGRGGRATPPGGRGGGGDEDRARSRVNALDGAMRGLRSRILGALTAYIGLHAAFSLARGYTSLLKNLIEVQNRIEKVRLGITQVSLVAVEFQDDAKKPLPFFAQFEIGAARAKVVTEKLLEDAIEFGLNYADTVKIFPALIGPALRLNATLSETVELTRNIAIFGSKIGLQQGQLVRTIDNILKGYRVENTELGSALGLTNEQVKKWKEQKILVQELGKLLDGINQSLGANLNTYDGQINSIQALIASIGQETTGVLFQAAKDGLTDVRDLLISIRNDPADLAGISAAINLGFTTMLEGLQYLVTHSEDIKNTFAEIVEFAKNPIQGIVKGVARGAVYSIGAPVRMAAEYDDYVRDAYTKQRQREDPLFPDNYPEIGSTGERLYRERHGRSRTPATQFRRGSDILRGAREGIAAAKDYPAVKRERDFFQTQLRDAGLPLPEQRRIGTEIDTAFAERFKGLAKTSGKEDEDGKGGTKDRMDRLARSTEKLDDEMLKLEERFDDFIEKILFDWTKSLITAAKAINEGKLSLIGAYERTADLLGTPSQRFRLTDIRQANERDAADLNVQSIDNEINRNLYRLGENTGLINLAQQTLTRQESGLQGSKGPVERAQFGAEILKTSRELVELQSKSQDYTNNVMELEGERVQHGYEYLALLEKQRLELIEQRRVMFDLGQSVSDSVQDLIFGSGSIKDVFQQFGKNLGQAYAKPVLDTVFGELLGKVDLGIDLGGIAKLVGGGESLPTKGPFGGFNVGVNSFNDGVDAFNNAVGIFSQYAISGATQNLGQTPLSSVYSAAGSSSSATGTQGIVEAARGVYDSFGKGQQTGGTMDSMLKRVKLGGRGGGINGQQLVEYGKKAYELYQAYQSGGFSGVSNSLFGGGAAAAAPTAASTAGTAGLGTTTGGFTAGYGGASTVGAGSSAFGGGGGGLGATSSLGGTGSAGLGGGGSIGGAGGGIGAGAAAGYAAAAIAVIASVNATVDAERKARKDPRATAESIAREKNMGMVSGGVNAFGFEFLGKMFAKGTSKLPTKTAGQRFMSGAISGIGLGAEGMLISAIVAATLKPPTTGALQSILLEPYMRDLGFTKDIRFAPGKKRVYTSLRPGSTKAPNLPAAYSSIMGEFAGIGHVGKAALSGGTSPAAYAYLDEAVQAAILGASADLGLAPEDALGIGRQFIQNSTGSIEKGAFKLLGLRKKGRMPMERLVPALGALVGAYGDLALSINTAILGQAAFTKDGLVSIQALERAAQSATAVMTQGVAEGLKSAAESGNSLDAAQALADSFTDTFTNRVAERLAQSTVFSKALTEAVTFAEKAATALAQGDTKGFDAYMAQAKAAYDVGSQQYLNLVNTILPSILGVTNSVGLFGGNTNGIINPSAAGIPGLTAMPGGTMPGTTYVAGQSGAQTTYLKPSPAGAPNVMVSVRLDGREIAKGVKVVLDNGQVGTKVPDAGLGIA